MREGENRVSKMFRDDGINHPANAALVLRRRAGERQA
jgi:hypothetical protein